MKRCLHRKVDFKTNAQKCSCFTTASLVYTLRSKQTRCKWIQVTQHSLLKCPKWLHFQLHKLNYSKPPFPSTLTNISFTLNVKLMKSQSMGPGKWIWEKILEYVINRAGFPRHLQSRQYKCTSSLHEGSVWTKYIKTQIYWLFSCFLRQFVKEQ